MYFLYNVVLAVAAVLALPYYGLKMAVTGKYRRSLGAKLGRTSPAVYDRMQGTPRIWIHAVSVGEVTAAAPIVAALRARLPGACLVLSTGTETGREMAGRLVGEATALIYYPLDLPPVVARVLDRVRPDVFVMTETELWPNFIRACRVRNIKVVMVNGRISPRSFRRYHRSRFFWKGVLDLVERVGVISGTDADRIRALGLPSSRLEILGNAKYDGLAAKVAPHLREEISRRLNLPAVSDDPVLVAGSTHDGEETVVLAVYRRLLREFPALKLILIPRHVERGPVVRDLVRQYGYEDVITVKEITAGRRREGERVIVVDVIGELFKIYSLATVVFCGGSLVPRGGQNILEPAAWGKVVCYGPSMEDFRSERELLEGAGAGICVRNEEELFAAARMMISRPDLRVEKGEKAREVIQANRGAAERYADLIVGALNADPAPPPAR
ncbi:MAG TPA: 3-deoxy-D-manno-octulosonic acid transferase [Syntrophales bacterium]|nr:3-deoxy-D-manno-octulosonic acid transferase [Syntrophales bacterium]HOU77684.1 3-deoxy-D-manno-octulosonic acid transferase [Syntrophales bacterium]HPC32231.1 3-deoxy-D-manno-octulosonic acid transferase [Syntrophales bacterium]HQG35570.1 3-deoxy-D-manno-octulosonic acid transferase [Syntrophales bacterium]HQJ30671.1 3-deoxy-D-manno-octulosonic acid transferase [Syntrophales bacterium]